MALSNWDTLAFNTEGAPSTGSLVSFDGAATAEIYKNWIYIYNKSMWQEGYSFSRPCIAQIDSGHVTLSGFNIYAERGPQNAIFVLITCTKYGEKDVQRKFMAGIGCAGYDDPIDRLAEAMGVDLEEWDAVSRFSVYGPGGSSYGLDLQYEDEEGQLENIDRKEITTVGNEHLDSQWVGVTQETYNEFLTWLKDVIKEEYLTELKDWLDKVIKSDPLRYCQGDAFFADAGVADKDQIATKIGGTEEPLISRFL